MRATESASAVGALPTICQSVGERVAALRPTDATDWFDVQRVSCSSFGVRPLADGRR